MLTIDRKIVAGIAVAGLIGLGVVYKIQHSQAKPATATQEQTPPALSAASCALHLGAIGFVQEKDGLMGPGKANLARFVALDNQWQNNPDYKQYQKTLDHNLAQDSGNMVSNLVALGRGCDELGIARAQLN